MARKISATPVKSKKTTTPVADPTIVKTTAARNSPIPNVASIEAIAASASPSKKEIGYDQIAERAYFISISGFGGDEMHNWLQAERELRGL
jgi:hypothetical protein